MKTITLAALAIAGLVCTTTTYAGDNGWYVLGGVGQTIGSNNQSALDNALIASGANGFSSSMNKPTVYKLQVGYQLNPYLAVEGGYVGSNNETYTATGGNLSGSPSASASFDGGNLTAVGILPLVYQFSLLGRIGVADIRESATISGPGRSVSASGSKTALTYGLGARYDVTKTLFIQLDVDSYDVGSSTSSNRSTAWMIDLGFKF